MGWPGESGPPADADTEISTPRATMIRNELGAAGYGEGAYIALAILEVSAAVDRLTVELRYQRKEHHG